MNVSMGWPADVTVYKVLTDWGGLIGGGAALIAGLIAYAASLAQVRATKEAVKSQLKADQEKSSEEVEIFRRSIAIEIRQMIGQALAAHLGLARLLSEGRAPITSRMLEGSFINFTPIIYPAVAGKIASLGDEAMDVAITYNAIAIARDSSKRLSQSRNPDDLNQINVAAIAEVLLHACRQGRELLMKVRTSQPAHLEKDAQLIARITEAESKWPGMMRLIQEREAGAKPSAN
jgi:hypothetical protein